MAGGDGTSGTGTSIVPSPSVAGGGNSGDTATVVVGDGVVCVVVVVVVVVSDSESSPPQAVPRKPSAIAAATPTSLDRDDWRGFI
jgi:hypothetical protein